MSHKLMYNEMGEDIFVVVNKTKNGLILLTSNYYKHCLCIQTLI